MKKEVLDFWDKEDFDAQKILIAGPVSWESSEKHAAIHRNYIETPLIKTSLEKCFNPLVVEIGCGVGRLLKEFAKSGYDLIGTDISAQMILKAREYIKDCKASIDLFVINGDSLPIPNSCADLVYSFLVFQHIQTRAEIEKYILEASRILRPGGYLRVQTMRGKPVPEGKFGGWHGQFCPTLDYFKAWFKIVDFEIVESQEGLGFKDWLWVTARKK